MNFKNLNKKKKKITCGIIYNDLIFFNKKKILNFKRKLIEKLHELFVFYYDYEF